jgi:hypothetical protein
MDEEQRKAMMGVFTHLFGNEIAKFCRGCSRPLVPDSDHDESECIAACERMSQILAKGIRIDYTDGTYDILTTRKDVPDE